MIDVRIDELVVTGFPLAQPERLAPAVERTLAVQLAGPPSPVDDPYELPAADVDELARAVAAAVAGAIHAHLGETR